MTWRLRIILPPAWSLAGFAAAYILVRFPSWLIRVFGGMAPDAGSNGGDGIVVLAALAYGVYRVVAFHPFYRTDYREWLERTPWTSRRPLPVGPVDWVWEDGLILVGLCVLCWADSHLDPLLITALPLMSHGIVLTASLFTTGAWAFGYATAFALGLAVRLGPDHRAFLAAAAVASLLARIGFRRSLAHFPWAFDWLDRWRQHLQGRDVADRPMSSCGWPYDQLRPELPDHPRIDLPDAALISLLAGWWIFAASALIDPNERAAILLFILLLGAPILGIWRLFVYRTGYAPPIGLWGRITTFRWIIPGHDQVYVGPVCTLLAPWPLLLLWGRWRVPVEVAIPLGFSMAMFVALSCKPSLRRWRLTGRHRIVPTLQQKTEYVQVG